MPRPKGILGDTGIALMYSHVFASHWTIVCHEFLETNSLINAPVSSRSFGLYEEVFLYILKQRNPIVE